MLTEKESQVWLSFVIFAVFKFFCVQLLHFV